MLYWTFLPVLNQQNCGLCQTGKGDKNLVYDTWKVRDLRNEGSDQVCVVFLMPSLTSLRGNVYGLNYKSNVNLL